MGLCFLILCLLGTFVLPFRTSLSKIISGRWLVSGVTKAGCLLLLCLLRLRACGSFKSWASIVLIETF